MLTNILLSLVMATSTGTDKVVTNVRDEIINQMDYELLSEKEYENNSYWKAWEKQDHTNIKNVKIGVHKEILIKMAKDNGGDVYWTRERYTKNRAVYYFIDNVLYFAIYTSE